MQNQNQNQTTEKSKKQTSEQINKEKYDINLLISYFDFHIKQLNNHLQTIQKTEKQKKTPL